MLLDSLLKHAFLAKDEHSLHSPFLFSFYNKTVKSKTNQRNHKLPGIVKDVSEITDFGFTMRNHRQTR
jgi:hypothetical protein